MVGIQFIFCGCDFLEALANLVGGGGAGQACSVSDAENVGIDGDDGLPKPDVEDHAGGFPPHAWQLHQLLAGIGHIAVEILDKFGTKPQNAFRLVAVESDGSYGVFQALLPQVQIILGGTDLLP